MNTQVTQLVLVCLYTTLLTFITAASLTISQKNALKTLKDPLQSAANLCTPTGFKAVLFAVPLQAAPPPPPATPAKPSSSTWPPPTTTSTTPAEAPASSSTPSAAVDAKHADRSAATADNKTDKKKAAAAAAVRGGSGSGLDPSSTRSLLIILHGKRVEDDLVRDAISSLKAEGHQVCCVAAMAVLISTLRKVSQFLCCAVLTMTF
jgi:type IV secretory pathway VirB10-like protein